MSSSLHILVVCCVFFRWKSRKITVLMWYWRVARDVCKQIVSIDDWCSLSLLQATTTKITTKYLTCNKQNTKMSIMMDKNQARAHIFLYNVDFFFVHVSLQINWLYYFDGVLMRERWTKRNILNTEKLMSEQRDEVKERKGNKSMATKKRWEKCIKANKHTSNTSISI